MDPSGKRKSLFSESTTTFEERLNHRMISGVFGKHEIVIKRDKVDTDFYSYGQYRVLGGYSYNGEKNLGEMGPIKNYWVDYSALRARSWQLYLESEIAQTVLGKYTTWVIGGGLKPQSEPQKKILKANKIDLDIKSFTEDVETRFAAFCKSKRSDYSNNTNLNELEAEGHKNTLVGGDVLVILRYIDKCVKVELIDGDRLYSPLFGSEWYPQSLPDGHKIINGVEVDERKQHIAYYVRKPGVILNLERIPARGAKSGMLMAYLVYGFTYRIDNYRGLPLLSVVMETTKKLERYKEATVGSAEERQKIAFFIEHQEFSDGDNPLLKETAKAWDFNRVNMQIPQDDFGHAMANKIAVTTNKQAFNLGPGQQIKSVVSKNELSFGEFYNTNMDAICSAVEIPPNVALSKYDANFSASRAALKDWEHTLNVKRKKFGFHFMQPIFDLWLHMEILSGRINAPGYLDAYVKNNYEVLEAYRHIRFTGAAVPHIDPVKEVEAERAKLGPNLAHAPLTTIEASTEILNGGDASHNFEQASDELKELDRLGIKPMPVEVPAPFGGAPNPAKKKKNKKNNA